MIEFKFLFFLISFLIEIIRTQTSSTVVKRISQLNAKGELMVYPNVYSSFEGHSLITFQGYAFSIFENGYLDCLFVNKETNEILRSPVLKDKTVCDKSDYECMYWQTSYQFSNTQLGCYSPKIPYEMRPTMKSSSAFVVLLETSFGKFTCASTNDCTVIYSTNYSNEIFWIFPQHLYFGSQIQLRIKPKSLLSSETDQINLNRAAVNLLGIKVGKYNCMVQTSENGIGDATQVNVADLGMDWSSATVFCLLGEGVPETLPPIGFMMNYYTGFSSIKQHMIKTDLDGSEYLFKLYPKVNSISVNRISPFGDTKITIKGKGFNYQQQIEVNLEESNNPCHIDEILPDSITCTTPKLSDDLLLKINNSTDPSYTYAGGPGLQWRYFENTNCDKVWNITGFPDSGFLREDIILETSSYSLQGFNYAEYADGYFKAPYTAIYRFYTTSDDYSRVYLTVNNVRTPIIQFNVWTSFLDYLSYPSQYSEWIPLNKGELYYLEIVHCQGQGPDHLQVGVEIKNSANSVGRLVETNEDSSARKFLNNQLQTRTVSVIEDDVPKSNDRSFRVTIKPRQVVRDLYEIKTPGLNTNYTLLCKNPPESAIPYKSLDFNNTITPSDFIKMVGPFIGDRKIVVRKININGEGLYFNDTAGKYYTDASYDVSKTFNTFYLQDNIFSTPSTAGTTTGFSFLFFIDSPLADRSTKLETDCFSKYNPGTSTPVYDTNPKNVIKKQSVSAKLGGYYQLGFGTYTTDQIPVTTTSSMNDFLNKIPVLTNKVWAFGTNWGNSELITYSIRVNFPSTEEENKFTNFTVAFNAVTGGLNDENIITIEELNTEKSMNYFPIPSDFLFTKSKNRKPQLRLIVNSIEAVCLPKVCEFNTVPDDRIILSYRYEPSNKKLNVTIDRPFEALDQSSVRVFIGDMACLNLVFDSSTATATDPQTSAQTVTTNYYIGCNLEKVIGGVYIPKVLSKYGAIQNNLNTNLQLNMTISDINPKTAAYVGGSTLAILGTNFPLSVNENLIITVASATCTPTSSTNTEIKCILSKKQDMSSVAPLNVTYNSVSVVDNLNLFSFDTSYQSPSLTSVAPNSVSPGEKQWVVIKMSQDITSLTTVDQLLISLVNPNTQYTIKLNAVKLEADTITVKYPGGPPGNYKVITKLNSNTNIVNELDFEITHEITSVTPNYGSITGGTLLRIQGKNFLKTQQNQMVMIDSIMCNYVNNTLSEIYCRTSAVKDTTQINANLTVSVDHVIQYFSVCKDSTNCRFSYLENVTALVNSVNNLDDQALDAISTFRKGDSIAIIGSNFGYLTNEEIPNVMEFEWGRIELNKSAAGFNKETKLIAAITEVFKFGDFEFKLSNSYGYSQFVPTVNKTKLLLSITCRDPVVGRSSAFELSPYGAVFDLTVDNTEGFNQSSVATLNACSSTCNLLYKNTTNLSCNMILPTASDCSTPKTISNFVGRTLNIDIIPLSKRANVPTTIIDKVLVQNVDITTKLTTYNSVTFTDKIGIVFTIKKVFTDSINNPNPDVQILFDNQTFISPIEATVDNALGVTRYTFELKDDFLAHGIHSIFFHQSDFGYLHRIPYKIRNPLKILDVVTLGNQLISSSFNGGKMVTITTSNFNVNSDPKILLCGIVPAEIISKEKSQIVISTPQILSYPIFENEAALTKEFENLNSNYMIETYNNLELDATKLFDENPFTYNLNKMSYVGVKIKTFTTKSNINLKIVLKSIDIHISEKSKGSDFLLASVEGSNDGVTYETMMSFNRIYLSFAWKSLSFEGVPNNKFKYIRFNTGGKELKLSEIKFYGKVVESETVREELICEMSFRDVSETDLALPHSFAYFKNNTVILDSISPSSGSSFGGNNVTFVIKSGSALPDININTNITLFIYDQPIQLFNSSIDQATFDSIIQRDSTANTITFKITMPENPILTIPDFMPSMVNQPLKISISSLGYVYTNKDQIYQYVDRWSDMRTWGGEFVPATNFETAYITNLNVLLDVGDLLLNMIVVERGSLIIEDTRDYKIKANNIFIRSGSLVLGTEANPFRHKFDLELTAKKNKDAYLPIFGNKVLAVLEGTLDMHGMPREPTWTVLGQSVNKGEKSIILARSVDWQAGDEIVIASSSFIPHQAEVRTIASVDNTNSEAPIIRFNEPLLYSHYGQIEKGIDMRAEVGLLTRNIKIHGSPDSIEDLYGSHIMFASMRMNINAAEVHLDQHMDMSQSPVMQTVGRISYIETYHAGQAYQMGRYPIHFHMIGLVKDSYVRGCSIHNTFNRALTIHGVNYFTVEKNVVYDTMGHSYFIEDGSETYNTIRDNLGILTRKSFSLLNSDFTPATFWITNPLNYVENNHAGGSEHYGFWLEFPIAPTGLNLNVRMCPRDMPVGSFLNNTSHSNEKYGVRIYPEMNPKTIPCEEIDMVTNFPSQAILDGITSYRNKDKGFVAERMGELIFQNVKVADNGLAGIDLSNIMPWKSYNIYNPGRPILRNSFVMGMSSNPADQHYYDGFITKGIFTPRFDNFLVSNITFYNFNSSSMACFSSCSRCEISSSSTDSCARTIDFEKIQFDGSEVNRVIWNYPWKAIYRDLDGSLSGSTPIANSTGDAVAYVSPFYPHNNVTECTVDSRFEDGLVCDGSKVQVRRIAFYNAKPDFVFMGVPMKIAQMNKLGTYQNISNITYPQEIANKTFSVINFKIKKDPNDGWAIPFVTNYNYLVSFGDIVNITQPLNFESLTLSRSIFWNKYDKPINLNFNYTVRRDEFVLNGNYLKTNTTNTLYNPVNTSLNNFGSFANRINDSYLTIHIDGLHSLANNNEEANYTEDTILDNVIDIKARQCANDDCSVPPPPVVATESRIRLWSDPLSWPTNTTPKEGDNVEVLSGWNMVLDVSTPDLNSLTINGRLSALNNNTNEIELKAKKILVFGGRFEIGNETNPHIGNIVKVTLTGSTIDPNLVIHNDIILTNKILANVNEMSFHGEDRSPYTCKLLQSVKAGDNCLYVSPYLKWRKGDEIVVATTTFYNNQTERFIIDSYDSSTGKIVLLNALFTNDHYGSNSGDVFANGIRVNLDERADVLMLTRNVRIGARAEDYWACSIINTDYKNPGAGIYLTGRVNMSNVEIINCGQTNTDFPALKFINNQPANGMNTIKHVSMHDITYTGVEVLNSNNVLIDGLIIYKGTRFGMRVSKGTNVLIQNSFVVQILRRKGFDTDPKFTFVDEHACYYICALAADKICSKVRLVDNTCAGSEFYGFVLNADIVGVSAPSHSGNKAYAAKYGLVINNHNPEDYDKDLVSGHFTAYNNWGWGIAAHPFCNSLQVENVISSNNYKGVSILTGVQDKKNVKNAIRNSFVIGQNPNNPICNDGSLFDEDPSYPAYQLGLIFSTSNKQGKEFPIPKLLFPLNKIKTDAAFGAFMELENVVFYNWNMDQFKCKITSHAIRTNQRALDAISLHSFENVKFFNVNFDKNFLYIDQPDPQYIGEVCGPFPCSGPYTVVAKMTNIQKDNDPSENFSIISAMSLDTIKLVKENGQTCKFIESWNAIKCVETSEFGHLFFENTESFANMRSLAPVYITSNEFIPSDQNIYKETLNTFADHACIDGYKSQFRTPRFPATVMMNKKYNVTFTASNPGTMTFQLVDVNMFKKEQNVKGVNLRLKYSNPQTVVILKNNKEEIKTKAYMESETFTTATCGQNKWTPSQNILEFYITNEPDCVLYLKTINSIQLSMHFDTTMDAFYKTDGPNQLIYNIAAMMKISPDQIRITNLYRGSVIAMLQILETAPLQDTSSSASPSSGNRIDNLETFAVKLVRQIAQGELNMPLPVLGLNYVVTKAPTFDPTVIPTPDTATQSDNNNNNGSNVIPTEPSNVQPSPIIVPTNSNTTTNNSTNNTTTNNGTSSNLKPGDDDISDGWQVIFMICIYCLAGVILVVILIVYIKMRRRREALDKRIPAPTRTAYALETEKETNTDTKSIGNNRKRQEIEMKSVKKQK